jgi:hypothetical protein
MEKVMSRLFNPVYRKDFCTESDLVEASKGIHSALKSTLPGMVKEEMTKLVGSILHKEIDNRLVEVTKSYEDRVNDLRKSYETRLSDLQYSNDKNLKNIEDLVKSVAVPGVTEDVGMEIVVRTTKMLDGKLEKILGEVIGGFEGKLKSLWENVVLDLDALKKSFEGEQNRMIEVIKSLHLNLVVPENSIHTNVEVKQLPSVVNFSAPKDSIKVEAKAILRESQAPNVIFNVPADSFKFEHKTILEESDKVSEKSIEYSPDGRPSIIREKIKRTK